MAAYKAPAYNFVALVLLPTTRLSASVSVRMSAINVDWSLLPHLSEYHREVAEHMAQGLGHQSLANILGGPPEQHIAQLEQLEAFVLG